MIFDCDTITGRLKLFWYDWLNYGLKTAIYNWKWVKNKRVLENNNETN